MCDLLFFFYCYGDHRYLHVLTHSFPTRRASDLDADMAMNFRSGTGKLADIFAGIDSAEDQGEARTVYLGSIDIPSHFDGLDTANPIDLGAREPYKSIWIGTRTRIAAQTTLPTILPAARSGAGASPCSRPTSSRTPIWGRSTTPRR